MSSSEVAGQRVAAEVTIRLGDWEELREQAAQIRFVVFVAEQKVPSDIELDEMDPVSLHALAIDAEGHAVGTGRLLPDGHIGRMAVLPAARSKGVGAALLEALVSEANRRGYTEVVLNAQTHAVPFYQRFGFVVTGETFYEAGIPHVTMRRSFD